MVVTNRAIDTAWERIPVSRIAKRVIWRLEQDRYALTEGKLYHLGEQLPDYYGCDPHALGYTKLEQLRGQAAERFLDTDMFFVKVSFPARVIHTPSAANTLGRNPTSSTSSLQYLIYAMSNCRFGTVNFQKMKPPSQLLALLLRNGNKIQMQRAVDVGRPEPNIT